jgi:radical SAM protein with 4Fe4S-binding SPASM domain
MDTLYKYRVNSVALHITPVCAHKCPFCYIAAQNNRKLQHPSYDKLVRIIDALSEAEVSEITFLGGDPCAYPNLIDLAKYASNKKISLSILSNTLSFPTAPISEVVKYITFFETTIHDVTPALHDNVCKFKGAYRNVVNNMRAIASAGGTIGIAINVQPGTANKIYELVERIVIKEKVPLNYIIIQRIVPFGRAANSSAFTIMRTQAEEALYGIRKVDKEFGIRIVVEDPFPLCVLPDELKKYMARCEWGFTKASISHDGDLSRCGADPRYRFGNILETPLLELWNTSEILASFRERLYLPGRCRVCKDMERCGGGCPLSAEIEKDHGIDYLYSEYQKLDAEIHGELQFAIANEDELSSILQIEWGNFQGYGHLFSVESLTRLYKVNPSMFFVVRDARKWVLGYATIVPIRKRLYDKIASGKISSIAEFPETDIIRKNKTDYYHLEVVATIPSRTASRAGYFLIKSVGEYLIKKGKHVTTSPITDIGVRLCEYFGFKHISNESYENKVYPIYVMDINEKVLAEKLKKF